MTDRKRLHRADPARVAPVRDFSKLYHGPKSTNGRVDPVKPASNDVPRKGKAGEPLAEGVELAYSVIEKYIAEGRRTAEGFSSEPYAPRLANGNVQEILERVLRFQAEMVPLWLETLATLVRVDASRNGNAGAPGAWPHPNGGHNPETIPVSIEVVSRRPVQVSVDLRPNSEAKSLVALGLHSVDSGKPTLTDIRFVPDEATNRIKLRIGVPENQPAGTYSGVIVYRDSGETRGTLSIRIAD
jgi:hypothetical protein